MGSPPAAVWSLLMPAVISASLQCEIYLIFTVSRPAVGAVLPALECLGRPGLSEGSNKTSQVFLSPVHLQRSRPSVHRTHLSKYHASADFVIEKPESADGAASSATYCRRCPGSPVRRQCAAYLFYLGIVCKLII